MLRFSKRSRLTFSSAPDLARAPSSARMRASSLWNEPQEEEDELFVLDDADIEDEVLVVDELYDDIVFEPAAPAKPGKAAKGPVSPVAKSELPPVAPLPKLDRSLVGGSVAAKLPAFALPPVTVPPPRPSFRSLPPVSAPPPRPSMLSATPPPVSSSSKIEVDSPTSAAVGVDDLVSAKQRFAMRFGRPTSAWGFALIAVGGILGFVVSIAVQPAAPGASAEVTTPAELAPAPRVDSLPLTAATLKTAEQAAAPSTTLTFDTPVDIQVPAPAPVSPSTNAPTTAAVAAAAPVATGPIMAVAPRPPAPTPAALPPVAAPKPAKEATPQRPAPASDTLRAAPKPAEPRGEPTRTVVARAPEPRAPASTADLAPSAVDALVREQLRSSLR